MLATVTLFEGPSPFAPFAAVMVEAECPNQTLDPDVIAAGLRECLPPRVLEQVALPLPDGRFETCVGAAARAIQDAFGATELPLHSERLGDGRCRVLLGYLDPNAAGLALRTAFDVVGALFARAEGRAVTIGDVGRRVQHTLDQLEPLQPDPLAHALIRAARRRGIPVTAVAAGTRAWLFGYGARGIQFFEAANDRDSAIGARIARDKFASNQLVARLGFPAVRHRVVTNPTAALAAAREIGYPLVVKPIASGKGAGVTVHITDDLALAGAFAAADRISPGFVLVERFVDGFDHRVVVIGGRFRWAVRRTPAGVTGDGEHTVAELMEIENRRRREAPAADIGPGPLEFDDEVLTVLTAQGVDLAHVPAAGARVALRRVANVARGGTLADCTPDVHPDVREMAEGIARGFRLDVVGLDFMTPDIGRSWRDVACAVLEVNATPGFSSYGRAEIVLDAKFPNGATGRIPTVAVLDASADAVEAVAAACARSGRCVGVTDAHTTTLDGHARFGGNATLGARVAALALDSACDALVVATTATAIAAHGLPLAHCDLALVGAAVTPALQRVLEATGAAVVRLPLGRVDPAAFGAIEALLARDAAQHPPVAR
ncbi:MAG TPA: hypothetical protein VFG38_08245 [Pseudomonadales bacterium]|nr:hypothetical protein [Pseudomonadales bacterium]